MAIKSQIRLAQLTGSLDDGSAANDPTSVNKSLVATSLQEVLDAVGAGIQKIHGAGSFNLASAGEFSHSITPNAASSEIALGSASKEWADLFLGDGAVINLGDDQDVSLTHVADTGILLNSTRAIQFSDANSSISNPGAGLKLSDHAVIELEATTSIQLDSQTVDFEDDGVTLQFGADDATTLAHSNGNGLLLGGSEAKLAFGQSDFNEAIFSGADGHLDAVATTEFHVVAPTINLDASSGVDISAGLTVGGDLTVNGTTTTVNSTTLTVDDSLIVLAQGNAFPGGGTSKDIGLILERNGNNNNVFIGFDESSDTVSITSTNADGSAGELTAADQNNTTAIPVRIDKLQLSASFANNGADLSIRDLGDGTDRLLLDTTKELVLNSTADKIVFTDTGAQTTDGFALVLDVGTDRKATFKLGSEASNFFTLDTGNNRVDIESGLHIRNGGSNTGGVITFLEDSDNGTNVSVLRGPAQLANDNVVFELPNSNGVDGYVLQTDGSGVTSWVAVGASNAHKSVTTITDAALAANSLLSTHDGGSTGTQNLSQISLANSAKAIDVFVNGQLLVSGTGPIATDTSAAGFTSGDYLASHSMSAFDLKFSFGLERDDVVTIIGRA